MRGKYSATGNRTGNQGGGSAATMLFCVAVQHVWLQVPPRLVQVEISRLRLAATKENTTKTMGYLISVSLVSVVSGK